MPVFKPFFRSVALLLLAGLAMPPGVNAGELPLPREQVVLTVAGKVTNTNFPGEARFDREMLRQLGVHTLTTTTMWTHGEQRFEGPKLLALLTAAGASGTTIEAVALNDYRYQIPFGDAEAYGVLVAMKMNGKEMPLREKGPLWLVYPRDDFPELKNGQFDYRWVWQLERLVVK